MEDGGSWGILGEWLTFLTPWDGFQPFLIVGYCFCSFSTIFDCFQPFLNVFINFHLFFYGFQLFFIGANIYNRREFQCHPYAGFKLYYSNESKIIVILLDLADFVYLGSRIAELRI